MTSAELAILLAGIIGYSLLVFLLAMTCLRWRYRGRAEPSTERMPRPLSIAESVLYACNECGCEWRRWADGFWNLADGEQRPAKCCRCGNMTEVKR